MTDNVFSLFVFPSFPSYCVPSGERLLKISSLLSGYSSLLRKRYDSLLATSTQQQQRLEEARRRRAEFDGCLETVLPRLQGLEERSAAVGVSRDKIADRLETLRVSSLVNH